MKGLRKQGSVWHLRKTIKGQTLMASTGTGDYHKAVKIAKKLIAEFEEKINVESLRGDRRPFSFCAKELEKSQWKNVDTIEQVRAGIAVCTEILGDPDVRDISVPMLEDLRDRLAAGEGGRFGERAAATVTKIMNYVTSVLKAEVKRGTMNQYPVADKLKAHAVERRALSPVETVSMLEFFECWGDCDWYDTVRILLDTGFRTGELSQLHARHVDFFTNTITLQDPSVYVKTATSRRTISMTPRVRAILERRITNAGGTDPKLVPYTTSDNYKHRWKHWRRLQPAHALAGLTPHSLRHTCCTRMLAATKDIYATQKWMGHANITTTEKYLHLVAGQFEDAATKLAELDKSLTASVTGKPVINQAEERDATPQKAVEQKKTGKVVNLFSRKSSTLKQVNT